MRRSKMIGGAGLSGPAFFPAINGRNKLLTLNIQFSYSIKAKENDDQNL
jgi:hypothetical protein